MHVNFIYAMEKNFNVYSLFRNTYLKIILILETQRKDI